MSTQLNFVSPNAEGDVRFILDKGWTGTNQRACAVEVEDVRSQADSLSLQREGFILTRLHGEDIDYTDSGQLDLIWKPQVEQKLLEVTGGKWLVLFAGPNVRFSEKHASSESSSVSAPARSVHSDLAGNFTYSQFPRQPLAEQAAATLRRRLGDREPRRWQIFNYWQMLSDPPQDCTLALCDRTSFGVDDIVEGKGFFDDPALAREDILGRAASDADFNITFLRHNPIHRWCYFDRMEAGEAIVFSTFDPASDGTMGRVPHGAFDLPTGEQAARPRNSIEIRALVIFEE